MPGCIGWALPSMLRGSWCIKVLPVLASLAHDLQQAGQQGQDRGPRCARLSDLQQHFTTSCSSGMQRGRVKSLLRWQFLPSWLLCELSVRFLFTRHVPALQSCLLKVIAEAAIKLFDVGCDIVLLVLGVLVRAG